MKNLTILVFLSFFLYGAENNDLRTQTQTEQVTETSDSNEWVPHNFDPRLPLALYQLVHDFQESMDKHSVSFYFSAGTILGALKHGGLIPWDDDADCCLLESEINKFILNVLPDLKEKGYRINYWDTSWVGFKIFYPYGESFDSHTCIDVFFLYYSKDESKYIYPTSRHKIFPDRHPGACLTKEEIFPIQKVKFGALEISAPNMAEEYLRKRYGSKWKTHIQKSNHLFKTQLTSEDKQLRPAKPEDLLPAGPFGPINK